MDHPKDHSLFGLGLPRHIQEVDQSVGTPLFFSWKAKHVTASDLSANERQVGRGWVPSWVVSPTRWREVSAKTEITPVDIGKYMNIPTLFWLNHQGPTKKNRVNSGFFFQCSTIPVFITPKFQVRYHTSVQPDPVRGFSKMVSSILTGLSIINHPFWGTSIFGNTHNFTVLARESQPRTFRMPLFATWVVLVALSKVFRLLVSVVHRCVPFPVRYTCKLHHWSWNESLTLGLTT